MRNIDVNWPQFFQALAAWETLPLKPREVYLKEVEAHSIPRSLLSGAFDPLVATGFLIPLETDVNRAKPAPERAGFAKALRAMYRNSLGRKQKPTQVLMAYLQDNFTNEEILDLTDHDRYSYGVNYQLVAGKITSIAWVQQFLDFPSVQNARQFEKKKSAYHRQDYYYFNSAEGFQAVKEIISYLLDHHAGVPLRELKSQFPNFSDTQWHEALTCLVRYLVVYLSLDPGSLDPIIWIWPSITERLRRPKAKPAEPTRVESQFFLPFLMEDMTALLGGCAAEAYRLRQNDSALFAKVQEQLKQQLVELPQWFMERSSLTLDLRIELARAFLEAMRFVDISVKQAGLFLEATQKGFRWLELSSKERLKAIIDVLDHSQKARSEKGVPRFLPFRRAYWKKAKQVLDLTPEVIAAFEPLKSGVFVSAPDFLRYEAEENNPLISPRKKHGERIIVGADIDYYYSYSQSAFLYPAADSLNPEEQEDLWNQTLQQFIFQRLLPLGGIQLGLNERSEMCFALTEIGQYLLGLATNFSYGHDERAEVVVQPNFDVVFLSPAPSVAATIGRFAERVGKRQVGILFRITKKSITNAAAAGMKESEALDVLTKSSSKELPANVEREMKGWFGHCRRIKMRQSWLIHCPDAEAAHRVLAVAGEHATRITDTVLEYHGGSEKAAFIRKLKEQAVFLEPEETREDERETRRRTNHAPGLDYQDANDDYDDYDDEYNDDYDDDDDDISDMPPRDVIDVVKDLSGLWLKGKQPKKRRGGW